MNKNGIIRSIISFGLPTIFVLLGCSMNMETDPETGEHFKCPYFNLTEPRKRCIDNTESRVSNAFLTIDGRKIAVGGEYDLSEKNSFGTGPDRFLLKEIVIKDSCNTWLRAIEKYEPYEIQSMYYQFQSKPDSYTYCNLSTMEITEFQSKITNVDSSTFKDDEGLDHGKEFSASYRYEWDGKILEFDFRKKSYTYFEDQSL